MSFRNIRSHSKPSYDVMRTRQERSGDEGLWQNIYLDHYFSKIKDFVVDDWLAIAVGVIAGVGGGALGFFLGQKYSSVNMLKKFIPNNLKDLSPQSIKNFLQKSFTKL